ncbi:MAG: DUF1553 domain-containing protein [Pedosphaera sp.]|nr:DUF1553 domain-containing protein [Pedosphaera sp.]
MPPSEKGPRLSTDEIRLIQGWIHQGAEYSEHWAFVPVRRPPLPDTARRAWVKSPVDAFILHQLENARIRPAPLAAPETLIRRITLDLLGLPPTPEEVAAFVKDRVPGAYERLVDRLLASPRYGERWGRHWLDIARYADSGGFETDLFFAHAWRFRDYVIQSFNTDKPYDQFVREQIAGDELYPDNREALIATGFYTVGPVLQESGMVPGKLEYDHLTDAVDTTGSAFLGMTLGCARCHDHKYDPISQKDYFGLQAMFSASDQFDVVNGIRKPGGRASLNNTLQEHEMEQVRLRARRELNPTERQKLLKQIGDFHIRRDKDLSRRVEVSDRHSALLNALDRYRNKAAEMAAEPLNRNAESSSKGSLDELLIEIGKRTLDLHEKESELRQTFAKLENPKEQRQFLIRLGQENRNPTKPDSYLEDTGRFRSEIGLRNLDTDSAIPVRVLGHREKLLEIRLLARGELEKPGEKVPPGFPLKLAASLKAGTEPNRWRSELAHWIAQPENPLTARVIVNRIWQWHFGAGLVRTPNDFGIRGERPTHPELLEWLASEFLEMEWSLKRLHRLILISNTYQMASAGDPEILASDPGNRLFSRFQPRRLEAEIIWDTMRSISGTLNTEMGGLSMAPPLDEQEQIGNFLKWPESTAEESSRRAVYLLIRRSFRFPVLSAFDLPDNISSCGVRDITTIPNQALTLLNSRTFQDQARAFAERLLKESRDSSYEDLIRRMWRHTYGRGIAREELEQVLRFFAESNISPSANVSEECWPVLENLCLAVFNTNELIFIQ